MICRCGGKDGYRAHLHDPPAHKYDFNYDFWVCARCLAPARMVFEKLTDRLVPTRATGMLSVVGDGEGRNIIRWSTATSGERIVTMTFHPYPRREGMPGHSQGRAVLAELWWRLDETIDLIRSGAPDAHADIEAKSRANTLADTLSLIMSPFYPDAQSVLAESMTRWKARQAGEQRESPGLAESIWDPLSRFDGTPYSRDNEARVRGGSPGKAEPAVLDTAKQGFIKLQLDTGAFKPEELAKMFGVSVEVIRHNYDLVNT